ncbi:MAG: hypothetical protein M3Z20_02780, partial [Chloroflexota bacterium]|nr:hypothetical protein [Chloroflexota bacterium]
MIPAFSRRLPHLLLASLFAVAISLPALPVAAQGEYVCQGTALVDDGLSSAAMGLTRGEIESLYGAGIATQTGWLWEFQGFDLVQTNCDLIVSIDPA